MSYEHLIGLVILAFIGVSTLIFILAIVLKNQIDNIMFIKENNKRVRENDKKRKEMLDRGEQHEWIKVVYGFNEVLACRKTGWCPDMKVYFTLKFVKEWERRYKINEELARYRDQKITGLANEYNMNVSSMEELAEKIFNIKKQFFVEKSKSETK